MAGDNKIIVGLEAAIYIVAVLFVILDVALNQTLSWVTPISWIVFLVTTAIFIIKRIKEVG